MRALEEIGKFLLKTPGPWVKRGAKAEPHMLLDPYIRRPKKHIDSIVFGPNQAFAIFSILAVGFEAVEHRHGDFVADLQKSDLARLSEILLLLKAREDRELDHAAIAQAQRRLDFGAEHIAFINDWIGKKFNLVERRPKKQPKQ
jgi:hypothetical protein